MDPGCYYYFGLTGSGKTYLSRQHLEAGILRDGGAALVVDAMPSESFIGLPHEESPRACLERLVAGLHACYTPQSLEEIAYLFRGCHAYGGVRILWDEAANHLVSSQDKTAREIAACVRGWRHAGIKVHGEARPSTYFITTQRPGELPPVFWTTGPEVYCFTLELESDLDVAEKRFLFNREEIRRLPPREYRLYGKDRFTCPRPAPPDPSAAAPPTSGSS